MTKWGLGNLDSSERGLANATIVLRSQRTLTTFLAGVLPNDRCEPKHFRTARWRSTNWLEKAARRESRIQGSFVALAAPERARRVTGRK
jgi:hypothetical protein